MGLAGDTYATPKTNGCVVTVNIQVIRFSPSGHAGDEASCCSSEFEDETSLAVKIEAWSAKRDVRDAEKVTQKVPPYIAIGQDAKPRGFKDK